MRRDSNKNMELKAKLNHIRNQVGSGRYSLAYKSLIDLEEEYYNNPYFIFEFGNYYYQRGEYDKSLEYFEKLLDKHNRYFAMYYIGKIKAYKKDYDEAAIEFDKIINSNHPDKSFAKLERVKIYKYQNQYDEALKLLSELENSVDTIEKEELMISIELEKADIYASTNRINEARELVSNTMKKIKRKKLMNKALFVLATIEFNLGNFQTCEKYIDRMENDYIAGKILMAKLLMEKKQFHKSREICAEVFDNYEIGDEARVLYIRNGIRMGLLDESQKEIEDLMKSSKKMKRLNYELGLIYCSRQNYDEAIKKFKQYIDDDLICSDSAKLQLVFLNIKKNNISKAYNYYIELRKSGFFKYNKYENYQLNNYFSKFIKDCKPIETEYYGCNQIMKYDLNATIEHVSKHKQITDSGYAAIFTEGIDIPELIKYAQKHIGKDNFVSNQFYDNYLLEYPNIGTVYGMPINKLMVITIPNSTDIITMYPFEPDFSNVNINEFENKVESKPYVKISQIDRFKKRYGMR